MGVRPLKNIRVSLPPVEVRLYIPNSEPAPLIEEDKTAQKIIENPPSANLDLDEPFGGWQVFKKPKPLQNGVYEIELKPAHYDLSLLNLDRFKYELRSFSSPKVEQVIINFSHCYNNEKNYDRIGDIADFLKEQRAFYKRSGKELSLAHLEQSLYTQTDLRKIDNFVHENVNDAIQKDKNHLQSVPSVQPLSSYPPFLKTHSIRDPFTITDIPGNYHG